MRTLVKTLKIRNIELAHPKKNEYLCGMDKIIEQWRPVVGYEELYEVSNLGRVRSLNYKRTGKVRVLKAAKNNNGYLHIALCKDGKRKDYRVHRLVAEAFIGECPDGYEIDHIDTNKTNNRVENLRYVTRSQNSRNPITRERHLKASRENIKKAAAVAKEKQTWRKAAEANKKPVAQYTLDGEFITQYPSAHEAARSLQNEGAFTNISACARGKLKYAYNYKWKYA